MKHETFSRCKDRDSKLDATSSKSKIKPTLDVLQNKPFKGRIFYLDLPWSKRTQTLENDIKNLGGAVERFFSKEIKYLVSSKAEARYAQRLLPDSPAPSPDSGVSSPHPSSRRDSHGHRGSSQGPTDTATVSRGKSLVERVVKEQSQERIQMNGILANAVEWGVKVLHVDDVISYIDKRKAKTIQAKTIVAKTAEPIIKGPAKIKPTEKNTLQRHNAGRISRPFVKVEDSSRHYRPIYLSMTSMPMCNLQSAPPCSPFLMEDHGKDDAKKKPKDERSGGERGARGKKDRRRGHDGREKRKGGYCECCEVKFENLKAHLDGAQHQAFSKSKEYAVVDRVIAGLTCDLVDVTLPKRVKCSVSTPLLHAATIRVVKEDIGTLAGDGKPKSEGFLRSGSTANLPLSDQTREKSLLVRKRSRGQYDFPWSNGDSLLDPSDAPEKSQSKRGTFEWEFRSQSVVQTYERRSLLSGEKNCASFALEHRPEHDMNPGQQLSEGNVKSIPGRECFRTNCSDVYTNSVLENRAENSAFWPLASTEPEPDLDSPCSSLQRKVRNVRPRRKEGPDLHIQSNKERECLSSLSPVRVVQQRENTSVCALDLWQLFQSSDNMDEDFKGFSDLKTD